MYYINPQLKNKKSYSTEEDFPMLKDGKVFSMKKNGDDFIIQTTISDNKELKRLVEAAEIKLNERITHGFKRAEYLMDTDNYSYSV